MEHFTRETEWQRLKLQQRKPPADKYGTEKKNVAWANLPTMYFPFPFSYSNVQPRASYQKASDRMSEGDAGLIRGLVATWIRQGKGMR